MNKIVEAYFQEVSAEHFRLDNLNKEAKITWFNSIEIDFSENDYNGNDCNENDFIENDYDEFIDVLDKDYAKIEKHFYDNFPFLPKGSLAVLKFVGPALEAFGLPLVRFRELLLGEDEAIEIEEDVLQWAFDIALTVMGSVVEKDKVKSKQYLIKAFQIAGEELDDEFAMEVVEEIAVDMIYVFGEEPPPKKKKKK